MSHMRLANHSINAPQLSKTLSESGKWVVLLHGLFATRKSMGLLENVIRTAGYDVLNWGYSTWWHSTQSQVTRLLPLLEDLQANSQVRSINFVTHSMGGILVRSALHAREFSKVQRLVMLAPPNRGSHLTRIKLGPFARCVPSIADLSEAPDSLPNRLNTPSLVEIGIIAASRDLIVPIANTSLKDQSDHCIVRSSHFSLPKDKVAMSQVLSFLQTGKFAVPNVVIHRLAA
jgi:hypothetical protein